MAEWSIAAVLKTVEGHTSGGSNPSLSAIKSVNQAVARFTPFLCSMVRIFQIKNVGGIGRKNDRMPAVFA